MTTAQQLQQDFANIGNITKFTPSDEGGGYTSYSSDPEFQRTTEFGKGLSNLRPIEFSENKDPLASEYGIIPSEQTATPTLYEADLTAPDKDGYYLTAKFSPSGKMVGEPERKRYQPDWFRKNQNLVLALPALVAGGYAFLPELLAGMGTGTTAATLGELGINTALAAGTPGGIAAGTIAGDALTTFNLGQTLLPDAPSAVQQGLNRFATGTITSGGDPRAGAMNAFAGGLSDLGNVALADVPSAIRAPIVNVATQVAQGKDLETAITNAATNAAVGGLSSIGNAALGEVPSAIRAPLTNVVSQLAQGKDVETALKVAAAGSLSSLAGSETRDLTDSKFVGDLAANAVKQLISTGEVDPAKLSGAAINQLSNTIVDSIFGPPSRQGGLNQTKGKKDSQGSFASDFLKSAVTGAVASAVQSARAPQTTTSRTSASQARTRAPIQVDVSTLQPIVRQQSQSGPPLMVDVSTLTPINRATNLSALLSNTGKSG